MVIKVYKLLPRDMVVFARYNINRPLKYWVYYWADCKVFVARVVSILSATYI